MGGDSDEIQVLVVEDEPDLTDLYAMWLTDRYTVLTANGGDEAIDLLSDDVDVVLLDRRMPSMSGDEVLAEIKERGVDCRVAMITAVKPDVDIVEMGFDDYLVKPVLREDLQSLVAVLLRRSSYDRQTQEFFSLASKKVALQASGDDAVLETDEYAGLVEEMEGLRGNLNETLEDLTADDFEDAFRNLPDPHDLPSN